LCRAKPRLLDPPRERVAGRRRHQDAGAEVAARDPRVLDARDAIDDGLLVGGGRAEAAPGVPDLEGRSARQQRREPLADAGDHVVPHDRLVVALVERAPGHDLAALELEHEPLERRDRGSKAEGRRRGGEEVPLHPPLGYCGRRELR